MLFGIRTRCISPEDGRCSGTIWRQKGFLRSPGQLDRGWDDRGDEEHPGGARARPARRRARRPRRPLEPGTPQLTDSVRSRGQERAAEHGTERRQHAHRAADRQCRLAAPHLMHRGSRAARHRQQHLQEEGDLVGGGGVGDVDLGEVPEPGEHGDSERRPGDPGERSGDGLRRLGCDAPQARHHAGQRDLTADPHGGREDVQEQPDGGERGVRA